MRGSVAHAWLGVNNVCSRENSSIIIIEIMFREKATQQPQEYNSFLRAREIFPL